jgi:hypothetical protein
MLLTDIPLSDFLYIFAYAYQTVLTVHNFPQAQYAVAESSRHGVYIALRDWAGQTSRLWAARACQRTHDSALGRH